MEDLSQSSVMDTSILATHFCTVGKYAKLCYGYVCLYMNLAKLCNGNMFLFITSGQIQIGQISFGDNVPINKSDQIFGCEIFDLRSDLR